ncbi:MAG: 50S ribosomal protein L11 methyltransferase [Bacillota bacterium]
MSIDLDETFSSIDLVTQCMTDERRTIKFQEAIEKVVKPGDVVLDSGTGSAVLALMAARAGAKKVIAVEYDPFVANIAIQNIAANGYTDVIDVIVGDMRNLDFGDTIFDVVIMEMLTTGMIDEFQVWTMNNLHQKGWVNAKTRFIPQRQDTFVAPAYADFEIYGLNMRMVRHLWEPYATMKFQTLAENAVLNSIPFDRINPITFSGSVTLPITKTGIINSVYITSETILADSLSVGDTAALNAPVVFPLNEDISVTEGDTVEISIEYRFGGGFRNFSANARKL